MPAVPDVRPTSVSTTGFADGLGRRSIRFDRESGTTLECLHLRPELAAFEPVLRDQAKLVEQLGHERIVRVQSLESASGRVTVVSELLDGDRLSDIIEARAGGDSAVSGMDAAFGFLLQVLPTISAMHAVSLVHGAIAPHRIILTTTAQIVLADAIYGSALPRLNVSQQRAWTDFGIAVPAASGAKLLDAASDVSQAAFSALTLALGRSITALDPGIALHELVREAVEIAQIRGGDSLAQSIRTFFSTALSIPAREHRLTADQAIAEVRSIAHSQLGEDTCLSALAEFARYDAPEPTFVRPEVRAPKPTAIAPMAPLVVHARVPVVAPDPLPAPEAVEIAEAAASADPVGVSRAAGFDFWATPPVPRAAPAVIEEPVAAPVAVAPTAPQIIDPAEEIPAPAAAEPTPVEPVVAVAAIPLQLPPRPLPLPVPVFTPISMPVTRESTPAVQLRIKAEPPPGYTPPRMARTFDADAEVTRAPRLSWKVAAAAVVVLTVGGLAVRASWPGSAGEAPAAATVVSARGAETAPAKLVAATGTLTVNSQPAGARVLLDGTDAGQTPLRLDAVAAGRHTITLVTETVTMKRTVKVVTGQTATIDIPVFSGWVAVFAPIVLDISEGGRSLGTTEQTRIPLPPGKHTLTLSHRDYGYSSVETVEVTAGEEKTLNITPMGSVNLNAQPWAEVWVDGARAGETPLANLPVALGTRVFLFKHPQFGERRITETITSKPAALSVDLTKPPSAP
ncbi:MAG: PEGA domain-containing protein [Vicinamibacterales bacterium]